MSNDLESEVRHALATLTDTPPPTGLAAAAIRTARRQRRLRGTAAAAAFVVALAVAPLAVSAVSTGDAGPATPADSPTDQLVITAYSGNWEGSLLLDPATGEYDRLPYRTVVPSPDGTQALVYTGENSPQDPLRIGIMDVATREVRWLEGYLGTGNESTGAWSPDGREVLITERAGREPPWGFAIVDADTAEATFVEQPDVNEINAMGLRFVWAPDGQEIALTQSTAGQHESAQDQVSGVRFYDRAGELLRVVPATGPLAAESAFSPDGTRMALPQPDARIAIVATATGEELQSVPAPEWGTYSHGDLIGWAGEHHLLVRGSGPSFPLLVVDLTGEVVQEVPLGGWWSELHIGPADRLSPAAAHLGFGP